MNIEARKIEMAKQILNINNERFINELEAKLIQLLPKYKPVAGHKKSPVTPQKQGNSTPPIAKIRENVNLNEIVAEQKTTLIRYAEIKDLTKKTDWKYSLKELLEALN